jgi:pimeloyl-ACP methyl ester carboxylesterase
VFVVGHDWGANIAWYLCLFRPDRVAALVNTSVAFMRHIFIRAGAGAAAVTPTDYFHRTCGPTYYICRFQVCAVLTCHASLHIYLRSLVTFCLDFGNAYI